MTHDLATILIVDDEKHTRDGLRQSLEDDFDVYVAANAADAMEVLKNETVDVMLTDLRLGNDDGLWFGGHGRGSDAARGLPFRHQAAEP